jgi:hypothetical protein
MVTLVLIDCVCCRVAAAELPIDREIVRLVTAARPLHGREKDPMQRSD